MAPKARPNLKIDPRSVAVRKPRPNQVACSSCGAVLVLPKGGTPAGKFQCPGCRKVAPI